MSTFTLICVCEYVHLNIYLLMYTYTFISLKEPPFLQEELHQRVRGEQHVRHQGVSLSLEYHLHSSEEFPLH